MTFFTSDMHFGHFNVISYCNRPFKTVEEMHEFLVTQWNEQVKPEDTVYFLGDFSFNKKWSAAIVPKLNGKKILICGNHDAAFSVHNVDDVDAARRGVYVSHGWETVHNAYHHDTLAQRSVWLPNSPLGIAMSHFPVAVQSVDDRYMSYRPTIGAGILLHGHLHGWYQKKTIDNLIMIDVGWDAHRKLLSLEEVESIIKDSRPDIDSPITEFLTERKLNEGEDND